MGESINATLVLQVDHNALAIDNTQLTMLNTVSLRIFVVSLPTQEGIDSGGIVLRRGVVFART